MRLADLEGKRILLLGYGKEGHATEAFLKLNVPSATIEIADKTMDEDYLDRQKTADVVVKTPGIPAHLVTRPFTTGTNVFFETLHERGMNNLTIGVTGSKGKSTMSSLIAAVLRAAGKTVHLIGNIGVPALEALMAPVGADDVFVLELSSYQLADAEFAPHIAVLTSFFPEHLDYHGSMEAYFNAKKQIVRLQQAGDIVIYNAAYPELARMVHGCASRAVAFDEVTFDTRASKLKGPHNLDNIRAAATVARELGISMDVVQRAVESFEPLPHRMTDVGTYRGIRFVDDAIATAPEPTIFAIETVGDVDTIFLGGQDRGFDFSTLAKVIRDRGIRNAVLFPDTGTRIKEALRDVGASLNILETNSMKDAVRFGFDVTAQGKTCVLSTASPSYSLWKNFEEKGDEFVKWVKEMGE